MERYASPNQKNGMTRWDVLVAKINPSLRPLDKLTFWACIGEKVDTVFVRNSTVRQQCKLHRAAVREVLDHWNRTDRKVTALLCRGEDKPTDVFLYQNNRYLDKVHPGSDLQPGDGSGPKKTGCPYTERKFFSKYLNDHAMGKVGIRYTGSANG